MIGDPAQPLSIRYHDFGNLDELVWVPPVANPIAGAIIGSYRSTATGTQATICETELGPRLSMEGRFGSVTYPLECIASGIWIAKPGILSFDQDGAGFRYFNYSTRGLPFRRCT
jgi:hypothetical protein